MCGQTTSGVVLVDSWFIPSAIHATSNYNDLVEVKMKKQLTFCNGFGKSEDDVLPQLAATMQLQALYGYATSDALPSLFHLVLLIVFHIINGQIMKLETMIRKMEVLPLIPKW